MGTGGADSPIAPQDPTTNRILNQPVIVEPTCKTDLRGGHF